MKTLAVFFLSLIIIPVVIGSYCPCAQAGSAETLSLMRVPCHGCCPEMQTGTDCQAEMQNRFSFATNFQKFDFSNVLKALSLGASPDIAINRRAYVPAGGEPSFSPPEPLYLRLNILRI